MKARISPEFKRAAEAEVRRLVREAVDRGKMFKAATFALSNLDKMTAQEFARRFKGKLHSRDGAEIDQETLIAGYEHAKKERAAGRTMRAR